MLRIRLQAEFGELKVKEYEVPYPESIYINKKSQKSTFYSIASLHCERIQGSFLLFYSRKIDLSEVQQDDAEVSVVGGKLHSSKGVQIQGSATAKQYLCFEKRLLMYVNENDSNSYLSDKKKKLPDFLLNKYGTIVKSVHFEISYTNTSSVLKNEEISIYLNLQHDE